MKNENKNLIPVGSYCYTPLGYINGKYKVKHCPFWKIRADKPEQDNGYCSFLKMGDWEADYTTHLWDGVKECGINNDDDEVTS